MSRKNKILSKKVDPNLFYEYNQYQLINFMKHTEKQSKLVDNFRELPLW
ncbi:hypothetical protein HMPREF0520_0592 [Lactobacillus iners DSM 13335]|uniref:Uncharacterized protein n=1 Tax=Lactobacillus iners DSM 13335 TaxID=525328 RepID=C8PBX2_9LACO|nr:hypothetical protein HMPREF0520_0592 [Lactobacillus iners DSM 13335]